jgi:colanic acid biosynthesis glycosyl transferase WcaI
VTVFASHPFYPDWKFDPDSNSGWWRTEALDGVTVHRCPIYLPKKFNALTRLIHYGSFAISCLFPAIFCAFQKRPDIVVNVAPTLLSGPAALLSAKISGAKSWLHMQDFEVEAGFATKQMDSQGLLARMAFKFEKLCINAFDRASSSSPEMCRKLVTKGREPDTVYEFRNWSDIENIYPLENSSYRTEWGIKTRHVALYSGSIAQKQGIDMLIDVAKILSARKDITFIICGNGPNREMLEKAAAGTDNLLFRELQPKEHLNQLLNLATIHLLPQKADAADLLLPSKLTNMLASGRPVVAGTAPETGLAREMKGCGLAVEPENPEAMARAIENLMDDSALWKESAKAARLRALEIGSRTTIMDKLDREFHRFTGSTPPISER